MRIYWDDNPCIDDTFYRVFKTNGGRFYEGKGTLADFTTEDEAIRFADEQNANGIDCDIVPILSERDYWDAYPARPCEL